MENDTAPAALLENIELDTPATLARVLRTTPQTINTWHRTGILPAKVCIGRVVRFDRREAMAALAAHSTRRATAQ
jgi:hypothetical protein